MGCIMSHFMHFTPGVVPNLPKDVIALDFVPRAHQNPRFLFGVLKERCIIWKNIWGKYKKINLGNLVHHSVIDGGMFVSMRMWGKRH